VSSISIPSNRKQKLGDGEGENEELEIKKKTRCHALAPTYAAGKESGKKKKAGLSGAEAPKEC
jgi:hypothetical protein